MNRINPLHIGILLVIVIIFILSNLASAKEELKEAKSNLESTKKLAVNLKEYKKIYSNSGATTKSLERILKLKALKASNIQVVKSKSGMIISSKSMDKLALNSIMGKLLNGSYNIEKLKIKKLSNEKVSLHMGIKW